VRVACVVRVVTKYFFVWWFSDDELRRELEAYKAIGDSELCLPMTLRNSTMARSPSSNKAKFGYDVMCWSSR
jgi:hypothetical protein